MLAVEERGMADGADAETTAFVGDLVAERGAFVAVEAEEAKFHELVGTEEFLEFGEESGGESAFAELERGRERLSAAAEMRALGAGERKFVHRRKRVQGRREDRRSAARRGRAVEGAERQFAPLAGREIVEREIAEMGAVQRDDGGADGGEHAADLVIAAFGERELGFARREEFQVRGGARLVFALELERAGGKERNQIFGYIAVERGAIDLGDFVLGRSKPVDERRLVGEQEEPAGILVEPADAGDLRIAPTPAGGEQRVDVGALAFVVRADESERFVEEQEEPVGMIERFAIDADVGGVSFLGNVAGGFVADRDGAGGDPVAGFAAGAVAEAGEKLVEAAHERGTMGAKYGGGGKAETNPWFGFAGWRGV